MAISNKDLEQRVIDTTSDHVPLMFRPTRALLPRAPVAPAGTLVASLPPATPALGVNPSGKGGIPKALLSLVATQTPVKQQSYTNSNITINFTYDPSDTNFYAVDIWFVGYHGNANPQLMSSGNTSPINFVCDSTSETVSVFAQTVSSAGMSAPLTFAAQTVVTLSGTVNAPPPPTIVQTLIATPTGYQFSFNFITGLLTDVISIYRIYRNTVNTSAGATVIHTIPQDTNGSSSTFVVQDVVGSQDTNTYYYWVSAVNTAGLESTLLSAQAGAVLQGGYLIPTQQTSAAIAVPNANFESPAVGGVIPGWIGSSATLSLYTGAPYAGNSSLQVNTVAQFGGAVTTQRWACSPGSSYFVSAAMKSDGTSQPRFSIIFADLSGGFIGGVTAAHGTSTSWSISTAAGTAPAGTVSMYLDLDNATAAGAGVSYFDALLADRVVDPSTTVSAKGGIPPTLNLGFSYTSTTTSITWTWTGIQILRADGTTTNVADGSQAITGLLANHSYGFYPYADEIIDGATTVRWVTMGTGSPAYAGSSLGTLVGAQTQGLQTHIGLSATVMIGTTPVSGTSSGAGGGSGSCLHEDMLVTKNTEDGPFKVRIGDIVVGDYLWTPTEFELVTNVRHRPCSTWLLIQTDIDSILCTPSHPFTLATGEMVRAEKLSLSDFLQGTKARMAQIQSISVVHKSGTKVSITVEPNHIFYAGENAELLAHNIATKS